MSDLSLALRISAREDASLALNSISKSLRNIEKQTEELNKNRNKSNQYWNNKDKREQEKHETWKTNLLTRETEKRIRLEQRAAREQLRHKENAKREMKKTEEDFRSSAARMALYVTAPTALLSTLSMRAYMQYEQQQTRLAMFFKEDMKDITSFIDQYAGETAFGIGELTSMMTTLQINSKKIGLETTEDVKLATKDIGDTLLALVQSAEDRSRFMVQFSQIMGRGKLLGGEENILAAYGIQITSTWEKMGRAAKEVYSAKDLMDVLKFLRASDEVQIGLIRNAKSFTQAWDATTEATNSVLAGLGKTLDKQFDLTNNTKIFAGLLQKIGMSLKEDNDNFAKGMASYLTMLGLTVVPTLLLLGHLEKLSFLIGESNMKLGIFKKRLFIAGSAASALYLISVDWKQVLKDIEENPMQGIIKHLDTAIALAFTLSGAFVGMGKAIDLLNKSLLLTNARLIAMAKSPVIRLASLGFTMYDTITDDERIQKNIEKARNDYYGNNNPSTPLGNLSSTTANPKNIEMLANLQSQPNIEVVNNINVDKSGNVTVETKQNDKNVYRSPYTAPIISDFSLGY
jgi:hypothetical protein